MTSIWELPNVYFQNLLLINNTPDNNLLTSKAYLSTPVHTLWAKIGWASIFLKNRIQIGANDLNLWVAKTYIFKMYSSPAIHWRTTFNLKCIFVHSHAHPLSKNWLSQHIPKKQIPNWRKWPQFVSLPNVYFQNVLLTSNTVENNLQPQMHICPLPCTPFEQKLAEQHIPKKQNPNWRKWPQFESCQMHIFKMSSSPALQWRTTYNLKCIFVHSHAHPLSKNWLSQHIPKQQIPNWRKWPQFESCQNIYIQKYTGEQLQPQMHICPLPCTPFEQKLAEPAYFKKQIPNWRKWPNLRVAKYIYSKCTPHQQYSGEQPSTSNAYLSTPHAHSLSKNWLSHHIFKKQLPNWRKLPQFESCQMYIFKIYSSSTIHPTITFNLKCISVHSHAHPLSKNWLSPAYF